jgi:hypothetical protein
VRARCRSPGQAFVSLPEEARHAVREEVRRDLGDKGGGAPRLHGGAQAAIYNDLLRGDIRGGV